MVRLIVNTNRKTAIGSFQLDALNSDGSLLSDQSMLKSIKSSLTDLPVMNGIDCKLTDAKLKSKISSSSKSFSSAGGLPTPKYQMCEMWSSSDLKQTQSSRDIIINASALSLPIHVPTT